jgi:hypothetical protein
MAVDVLGKAGEQGVQVVFVENFFDVPASEFFVLLFDACHVASLRQ